MRLILVMLLSLLKTNVVFIKQSTSVVARTSRILGQNTGTLRLYELLYKDARADWDMVPKKMFRILQPSRLVLKPYCSAVYVTYTANSRMVRVRTRLVILWIMHNSVAAHLL